MSLPAPVLAVGPKPITGIVQSFEAGKPILDGVKVPAGDAYTIRMENGDGQDASGNPPSLIFSQFNENKIYGVYEGTGTSADEKCTNNRILESVYLGISNREVFNGIRPGEAPVKTYNTKLGFNLKSIDIQPGGNGICISNIVIKASSTQARQDEVFIPLGNLAAECGYDWSWGRVLDSERQRCAWLQGNPAEGSKAIKSLHLNMEKIAVLFNPKSIEELKKSDMPTLCKTISDNAGKIPNRNDCAAGIKTRATRPSKAGIDTIPIGKTSSTDSLSHTHMDESAGSESITNDREIYNTEIKRSEDAIASSVDLKEEVDGSGEKPTLPADPKAETAETGEKSSLPADPKVETAETGEKPKLRSRAFRKEIRQAEKNQGTGNQGASTPGAGNKGASTPGAGNKGASTPGAGNQGASTPGAGNKGASTLGTSTPGTTNKGATGPRVLKVQTCEAPKQGTSAKCTVNQTITVGGAKNDDKKDVGGAKNDDKKDGGAGGAAGGSKKVGADGSGGKGSPATDSKKAGAGNKATGPADTKNAGTGGAGGKPKLKSRAYGKNFRAI